MEVFNSITEKLLQTIKILIPEFETSVSFLFTRMQEPTTEDWGKLIVILELLKATNNNQRILGTDDF